MAGKVNWKKYLQAGTYATDALSKGSAGGLGKAIVDSKIDLSGKPSETTTEKKSGASNGAIDINPFDTTNTKDAEGGDLVSWKKMKKANYI
tara:strand:+ start:1244 stop:1516 length:273 start_codon:yes stop_codon:yes gene_type:complete